MGKIYKQSKLDLYLNTGLDISTALSYEIQYRNPSGTTGSLTASLGADKMTLCHQFVGTEINLAGIWYFWPFVVFSDNRSAPGETVRVVVYNKGH